MTTTTTERLDRLREQFDRVEKRYLRLREEAYLAMDKIEAPFWEMARREIDKEHDRLVEIGVLERDRVMVLDQINWESQDFVVFCMKARDRAFTAGRAASVAERKRYERVLNAWNRLVRYTIGEAARLVVEQTPDYADLVSFMKAVGDEGWGEEVLLALLAMPDDPCRVETELRSLSHQMGWCEVYDELVERAEAEAVIPPQQKGLL